MSKVVDMSKLVYVGGDIYEDDIHLMRGRPLDTARLAYAKLRNKIADDIPVEVIWNHFKNQVTIIVMADRPNEVGYTFDDSVMARTDRIAFLDSIVEQAKEVEGWLRLQQQS